MSPAGYVLNDSLPRLLWFIGSIRRSRQWNLCPRPVRLGPVAKIHLGKNVVHRLDLFQPRLIHLRGGELLVQCNETQQMVLHPLPRVIWTGAGAQDEGPVRSE